MIPLSIRASLSDRSEADFLLRLTDSEDAKSPYDRFPVQSRDGSWQVDLESGPLEFPDHELETLVGDVMLVSPSRQTAQRLIRARSEHNTFLVTERCDQLCVMCSQPPKKYHHDLFPLFTEAALLAPHGATIGISGGEPTLFKQQLFTMLEKVLDQRQDLSFHVLTNGQHFTSDDIELFRRAWASRVLWGIPIYSSADAVHDEIVGKSGALARLRQSLACLMQTPVRLELRTVLMRSNVATLPDLAKFIALHLRHAETWAIMQLENIGYARMNWDDWFFDNSRQFDEIASAIGICERRGLRVQLYNFPLCTVPDKFRAFAVASISDWKAKYLRECENCSLKPGCGGFFEWYRENNGFAGIRAQ